jgi:sigma-B regulation protein RsbU (phosphoserine phosphatase)
LIAPAIPLDESKRMEALRSLELLDTPAEERFDQITRLATRIFDTPMAYVSLIDTDRQWFKSACGLTQGSQTGRDISFCGHAIHGEDALIIPDTLADRRFADSPLVTNEPRVRFYAGQPLRGPGGMKVGTFCIADRRPRLMNESERESLRGLAGLIERELSLTELVRVQNELLVAEERALDAERERAETLTRLVASQQQLSRELAEASAYVRSLLPAPLRGEVVADWCFEPCSTLGGDSLGYHWIDDRHLAIYLLDVCGHGVGSALLSSSAVDVLRSSALANTEFREPGAVLAGLNAAFPMDRHDQKFFTIWYGVYDKRERVLRYATGGHPPAVLVNPKSNDSGEPTLLATENLFVGLDPNFDFKSEARRIEPGSRLFVFSDGAYELPLREGRMMELGELVRYLSNFGKQPTQPIEAAFQHARSLCESDALPDDFSLMRIGF